VGGTTRGLLADLVTNLEELLAALEKSQRDQEQRQAGAAGGRPQEPGEQPLVDKLSELKMIRSLQMRVNARTQRFAQLLDETADRADAPEIRAALERLAERQRQIERAAHDIVAGRTEE
jgi:two-component sensor histidine kinase